MKKLLEKKFFPFVIKPGRYAGLEPGQVVKKPDNKTKYLHAFPEKYEIGQAYMGLQTLYHVVNKDDRFLCERVFAVDTDAEAVMRKENIPLFSLESYRPAKEFDAVGFTISYELVMTNLLTMLDLSGFALRSRDRDESDPIIMAGGPTIFNPEPFADFIDLFFIGDAEEGLIEILDILYNSKDSSKQTKLERIVKNVKSVYVSSFYDNHKKPLHDWVPSQVEARVVPELKTEYYPEQPIVPIIDVTHNFLSVEIMRGCPQGCRFCQAGPIYRPVRPRNMADISSQIERQLKNTGYQEVTLLSLSSSDYPEIGKLATSLARRLADQKVSITLPSLRPETITSELLDAITKVRKVGLTLAPEAGTERLRQFLRKDFPDQAIYDTVKLAYEKGWTTIKLYFMVGLPTETDDDLMGIVKIIEYIHEMGRKYPGKKTINVTLSPFAPKPHTPFQWDQACDFDESLRKIYFIKKNCRVNTVNFKYNEIEMNILQAVIGRGGREICDVIESAFKKGCRFDGWSENFNWGKWSEAFSDNGIVLPDRLKPIPFSVDLPWSIIRKGVSVEHLVKERNRTSTMLKDYEPVPNQEPAEPDNSVLQFGRAKKKVASKNNAAPTKNQLRILWGKSERLKYSSHLDNLRMIEKAIRRSKIPIAYTQGFNPSMKLSFGPPLPLGFTSQCEILDITLNTNVMPYMLENLSKSFPEGLSLIDSKVNSGKQKSLGTYLNRVEYTIPYSEFWTREEIQTITNNIIEQKNIMVERIGKDKITEIDIRPGIYEFYIDEVFLTMVLGIGEGGYVRPNEVIKIFGASDNYDYLTFQVHRKAIYHLDSENNKLGPMEL